MLPSGGVIANAKVAILWHQYSIQIRITNGRFCDISYIKWDNRNTQLLYGNSTKKWWNFQKNSCVFNFKHIIMKSDYLGSSIGTNGFQTLCRQSIIQDYAWFWIGISFFWFFLHHVYVFSGQFNHTFHLYLVICHQAHWHFLAVINLYYLQNITVLCIRYIGKGTTTNFQ